MGNNSSSSILQVINLNISFPDQYGSNTNVVNEISFDLKKGEILGIVGESGSGKSLTALSIIGLLPSQAQISDGSSIKYYRDQHEIDLMALKDKDMVQYRGSDIAMVFQEPMSSLNPSMKCGAQVLESVFLHHALSKEKSIDRVFQLFKRVGLNDTRRVYNSYPHELSGGQLQRVMIAIAVSGNPSILIADEPTTALDVTVQKEILQLLRDIKEEYKTSTIFISHDLAVINQICDRVIVMKSGVIMESGTKGDIFNNPKTPYTKGLIASRPPDSVKLRRLATVDMFEGNDKLNKAQFINENKLSANDIGSRLIDISGNEILVRVKDLTKEFQSRSLFSVNRDSKIAVDNISFQLHKNEILGLVGESGSGKSTVAKLVSKLLIPSSGCIEFSGANINQLKGKGLKQFRRDCQIIFQDPFSSLNPKMKIGKAIEEPFYVHRIGNKSQRKEWAIDLLENVGMEADHYNRYPHEFSGGQRQRISIARALTLKPKLLICDESVSALDVSVQAKVLNLLLDLKNIYDMSYLFISHDLSVVHFISDNIMVMKEGEIVEKGTASQIYSAPKNVYTQRLIAAIPKFNKIIL